MTGVASTSPGGEERWNRESWSVGRLGVKRRTPTRLSGFRAGIQELLLPMAHPSLLYAPPGLSSDVQAPLLVLLHGAGGNGHQVLPLVAEHAERERIVVIA